MTAARHAARVLCVGHAAFDSVFRIESFPPRPTKVRALQHDESIGGMAANAACAIAALGGRAAWWGPLGNDDIGQRIRSELAHAGVDTDGARMIDRATSSHSAIIVDAAGERLIISQRGTALEADATPLLPEHVPADVVLIDVRWNAGAERVARRARDARIPVVLDGEMGNVDLLRRLVPLADHLIFSEPGFAEWIGKSVPIESVAAYLTVLVDAGATLAAVTHGERGVVYAHAGGAGHAPAFPIRARETLGAGDVFHGAYALALAEGQPIDAALRFAAAAAALKCSRTGGRAALADRAEVERLLAIAA
ncbi:MAG: PfkB family carbohydrate kinase [Lautropia sp.]